MIQIFILINRTKINPVKQHTPGGSRPVFRLKFHSLST